MPRIRFSLAALMGTVPLVALALLALRNASPAWANTTFTITLTLLLCSLLGLIYRRHHARAFWLGFAFFGWTYLLFVNAPWLDTHVGPRLITNSALNSFHQKVFRAQEEVADLDDVVLYSATAGRIIVDPAWQVHLPIGRSRTVRAAWKIKRLEVLDETLVEVMPLAGSNEIQLAATAPGSTYLNLWDVNERLHTLPVTVDGVTAIPNEAHFRQVGHSLFALLFALLGGYVAVCFYNRSNQSAAPHP